MTKEELNIILENITTGAVNQEGAPLAYSITDTDFYWDSSLGPKPSLEDMERHKHLFDEETCRFSRKIEYPPIEEQLDYIYHYGVDLWRTEVIDPVKSKYPKPEGTK